MTRTARNKSKADEREAKKAREDPLIDDDEEEGDEEIQEEDGPPVVDPYEVLELEKEATPEDVKKAYRKMALKHHPDKAPESEKDTAKIRFQEIAFAYAILSDTKRRARYDLTGSTSEVLDDDENFDWLSFYREQFEDVVNEENIKRISDEYKNSDREKQDLLDAYTRHKGRLDAVYESVMLSDILEDDDRFRTIIDAAIEAGEVESYKTYEKANDDEAREKVKQKERKRREAWDKKQKKEQEAAEAAESAEATPSTTTASGRKSKAPKKKAAGGSMADLAALIQGRQKARVGNFFDHLEAKYAPAAGKRASSMVEPSEEAFAAMAARKKTKMNDGTGRSSRKTVVDDDEDEDLEMRDEDMEDENEMGISTDEPASKKKRARGGRQRGGKSKA